MGLFQLQTGHGRLNLRHQTLVEQAHAGFGRTDAAQVHMRGVARRPEQLNGLIHAGFGGRACHVRQCPVRLAYWHADDLAFAA